MSAVFWIAAATMAFVALAFVIRPVAGDRSAVAKQVIVVGACALAVALGLYAVLGTPDLALTQATSVVPTDRVTATSQKAGGVGSVASLVDGLRVRLDAEPDDADGWLLLARSYEHLDRRDDALAAYQRAQALGNTDLEFEAKLFSSDLAAITAPASTGPMLRGRVSLSPDAAARANPNDAVFIFAKESPDHRMPVVATRKKVRDLPMTFELTDKEIMVPGATLADFDALVVNAKVSPSGSANDNSAGLEAWSEPVSPVTGEHVEILITTLAEHEDDRNE